MLFTTRCWFQVDVQKDGTSILLFLTFIDYLQSFTLQQDLTHLLLSSNHTYIHIQVCSNRCVTFESVLRNYPRWSEWLFFGSFKHSFCQINPTSFNALPFFFKYSNYIFCRNAQRVQVGLAGSLPHFRFQDITSCSDSSSFHVCKRSALKTSPKNDQTNQIHLYNL